MRMSKYNVTKEDCLKAINLYEKTRMTQVQVAQQLGIPSVEIIYILKYYRICAEIIEDKK